MLVGTHALMPVCACLLADNFAISSGRDRIFPARSMWAVGILGILPDICTPHLSLEDRYASWSHTVWFMAGLIVVVAMIGCLFEKGYRHCTQNGLMISSPPGIMLTSAGA